MRSQFNLALALQILEKNTYLSVKQNRNRVLRLNYGPFGTSLKRNILLQWEKKLLNSSEITTFSVSARARLDRSNIDERVEEIAEHYPSVMKLQNNKYPFGLATWRNVTSEVEDTSDHKEWKLSLHDMWNPVEKTVLTQVLFCSAKQSLYLFGRIQKLQIIWWKSLCQMSSSFSFNYVQDPSLNYSQCDLVFSFMDETFPLVNIMNMGQYSSNKLKHVGSDLLPHVIICESILDRAVLTFLLDSYQETDNGIIMKLNHSLVPFQVSFVCRDFENKDLKDLNKLVEFIAKDLRKAHLSVFLNLHTDCLTVGDQLSRFDAIGIPYVIILDSQTLSTGIVALRNRDKGLEEKVHLTELNRTFDKYL